MRSVVVCVVACGLGLLLTTTPSIVRAAPAPGCTAASLSPHVPSVPANLPGFAYSATTATTEDIHLYATTPGGSRTSEVPLTLGPVKGGLLKVAPTSPLTPDTSYELDFSTFCNVVASSPLKFTAKAEAPIPTKIGDVVGQPSVGLSTILGQNYILRASYKLTDEMQPWASVYTFTMTFDGQPIALREATVSAAGDSVQVVGMGVYSASEVGVLRKHTFSLRASLPFAPSLETAVGEMEFEWPAQPPPPTPSPTPTFSRPSSPPTLPETGSSCSMTTGRESSSSSSRPFAFALLFAIAVGAASLVRRRIRNG